MKMRAHRRPVFTTALLCLTLAGCGGGGSSDPTSPAPSPVPVDTAAAAQAAQVAADTDPECTSLGDFYWEIGDATQALASGQTGQKTIASSTAMSIASASKLLFGAYVLEILNGTSLTQDQQDKLRFISGYTEFANLGCTAATTVQECYAQAGGTEQPTAANVGKFYYSGAHDQKLAIDLGMGDYTAADMGAAYSQALGVAGIEFSSPQPAGGGRTSAAVYANFLRRLIAGQLALSSRLGENAVCTQPSSCATAIQSPAAQWPWQYSYNHWVETYDGSTVDAYSSAGAFGFYPWVTPDRKYYGLLARVDLAAGAGGESAECGHQIRKAWLGAL